MNFFFVSFYLKSEGFYEPSKLYHVAFHLTNLAIAAYLINSIRDPIPAPLEKATSFFGLAPYWEGLIEAFLKKGIFFGFWLLLFSFTSIKAREVSRFSSWMETWRESHYNWHQMKPKAEMYIPRIIHQTYISRELPDDWKDVPDLWQSKHPGWEYRLWTDDDLRNLIKNDFSWFLPTFDSYTYNIQRVDSARYFILLKYGGVYVDLDLTPKRSLETFLRGHYAIIPKTPNYGLTNALMASVPGHAYFQNLVWGLPERREIWLEFSRHLHIIAACGPFAMTLLSEKSNLMQNVTVITPAQWGKPAVCGGDPDMSGSILSHLKGESWNDASSTLAMNLFCSPGALIGFYLEILFCFSFVYLSVIGFWSGKAFEFCFESEQKQHDSFLLTI